MLFFCDTSYLLNIYNIVGQSDFKTSGVYDLINVCAACMLRMHVWWPVICGNVKHLYTVNRSRHSYFSNNSQKSTDVRNIGILVPEDMCNVFPPYLNSVSTLLVKHKIRDVKLSRSAWSPDHFIGLGLNLTVTGFGLGLVRQSHTFWSRGVKSVLCSSVMTSVFC